jgi:AcrR family transcriptional regulator
MPNSPPYDERLDQLLATSAEVFAEQGYHGTSMRDLSRATGMSLAGMYYYVRGKDDLLFRIQERCFTGFLQGARTALGKSWLTSPTASPKRVRLLSIN